MKIMNGLVDIHSHILPKLDDGSSDVETSLELLKEEKSQGVEIVCATSHFYPQRENPKSFISRREESFYKLKEAINICNNTRNSIPNILLGAETYFFYGMRNVEDLKQLCIGSSKLLLIEIPFFECTNRILEEIDRTRFNLDVIPVIAHVDRYMELFHDWTLPERLLDKNFLLQFNSDSIKNFRTRCKIIKLINNDIPFFIGSDAHNMEDRKPNLASFINFISKKTSETKVEKLINFTIKNLNI